VVQAVAHQTQRTSNSTEEIVERLDGRLWALASTHSLLVETDRQGADLGALARKQQRAKADAQNARASEAPQMAAPGPGPSFLDAPSPEDGRGHRAGGYCNGSRYPAPRQKR
jgi:conjugal transfer/entry exclusion protein